MSKSNIDQQTEHMYVEYAHYSRENSKDNCLAMVHTWPSKRQKDWEGIPLVKFVRALMLIYTVRQAIYSILFQLNLFVKSKLMLGY